MKIGFIMCNPEIWLMSYTKGVTKQSIQIIKVFCITKFGLTILSV